MPDTARVSAPPAPPPSYPGPTTTLISHTGQQVARLRTTTDQVVIEVGNRHHSATSTQAIKTALTPHLTWSQVRPVVDERPWATRRPHAILLLFLAAHWPEISHPSGNAYHLTLSYALPLALDQGWRYWAEEHAEHLIATHQLAAVPAADLVAVRPNSDAEHRHRRLLRAHHETSAREHHDLDSFLSDWSHFSAARYGHTLPDDERFALHGLLSMSNCAVRDFTQANRIIGRSLVCWHQPSNTLFDLMATWSPHAARLRPGIYSGVYNLLDAQHNRARFSLCYGQFSYKDEIVEGSERLAIQDIQRMSLGEPLLEKESTWRNAI